jgi:hypothetical protein
VRTPAIEGVLRRYGTVLESLEEAKTSQHETRAAVLVDRCEKGTTVLVLQMGLNVFVHLEQLNTSLQSTKATVSGMLEAVRVITQQLHDMRTDDAFRDTMEKVNVMIREHQLEPISIPRQRRPPARLSGPALAHQFATAEELYCAQYFALIDETVQQLSSRFDATKSGISKYQALENMLLTGSVDSNICDLYPEMNAGTLSVELPMFKRQSACRCLTEALQCMQKMVPDVQQLFPQVKELLILLTVNPASSATAERSFSCLRRLKTWLRTTMSQQRLNSSAVCNTHRTILDVVDVNAICDEFISRNDFRMKLFGLPVRK